MPFIAVHIYMSNKGFTEVYCSQELDQLLDSLDPNHKFHRWIEKWKNKLLISKTKGIKQKREQIPDYYIRKYGLDNLYLIKHPEGHRSCYTLHQFESEVCPVILDMMTHPEYEKRFGY